MVSRYHQRECESHSFLSNLQRLGGNYRRHPDKFLALMRVCLLLCRLRLSKSIESMNVACKKSVMGWMLGFRKREPFPGSCFQKF